MNYINNIQQKYKTKSVSSDNIGINCPCCIDNGHTSDTGYNLWVSISKPVYHCWRCGAAGRINKLLKLLGISVDDELIYEDSDYDLDINLYDELIKIEKTKNIELPQEYIPLYRDISSITGKQALDYLLNRNISYDKIERYKLGFCISGYYSNRIILPVYDCKNELIFFVARSYFANVDKKILNPSKELTGVGKSEILYNINNNIDKDEVIINEGPFDAISTDGVALFGKIASDEQLHKIKKLKARNVTIMLDSDAVKYAYELADKLYGYKKVYICELKEGDPNTNIDKLDLILENKKEYSKVSGLKYRLKI